MGFTFGFGAPLGYAAAAGAAGRGWAGALRRGDPVGSRLRHDLRASGPRGRRAGRRALHRAAVRRAHPAVPGRLLRRHGGGARVWPAGWPGCRAGSTPRCCCRRCCSARQVATLDIDDPASCLRLFRANREAGLAVGAGAADRAAVSRRRRSSSARNTLLARAPLVPEIALHLATEITPIWQATEEWLAANNVEPPFWAFAWPGGQALARHVLDHPALVAGPPGAGFRRGRRHRRDRLRARRRRAGGSGRDRPARRRRDPAERRARTGSR